MSAQRPSSKLLLALAITALMAVFTLARPYVGGSSSDSEFEDFYDVAEEIDLDEPTSFQAERWVAPSNPRNPFVTIDLGTVVDDGEDGEDGVSPPLE